MIHVGVLSPVTGGFFFGEVLAGVVREVTAAGGRVTLVQTLGAGRAAESFTSAPEVVAPAGWEHLDGFVAIAWATSQEYLQQLRDAGKPVVLISNDMEIDAASVVIDNDACIREGVDHLVEHGHTKIAFVGNVAQTDMLARQRAYLDQAQRHGVATRSIHAVDHVEVGGASAAPELLEAYREGFTAVVATTDRVAIGLIHALAEHGVQVPRDVAIIGFDDVEAGWTTEPPLSTMAQDFAGEGAFAAGLLLAELRGEPVEHRRYTIPAEFVRRRSCGCPPGTRAASGSGERAGEAVAAAILAHLGLDAVDPADASTAPTYADADLVALEGVVAAAIAPFHGRRLAPERRRAFLEACIRTLLHRDRELRGARPGTADLIEHCVLRVQDLFAQAQAATSLQRIERLTETLAQQVDVGMALLGESDADPADLTWLRWVPVRAGLLGLWDGPPEDGVLRVGGVYDPNGHLTSLAGTSHRYETFPPRALIEMVDAEADEVTYVVPVKGSTGNHGMLGLVGRIDTEFGAGRATYNHWAALLGAALREKRLLESVRGSEERYAHAANAAKDGLWEHDVATGQMYLSQRCRDVVGLAPDAPADATTWVAAIHPDDRDAVRLAMADAVAASGTPVEVEYRVVREDGSSRWVLSRALGVGPAGGHAERLVGSLSDVDERKRLEDQLRQAALYDTVTGLPNRRLFLDRLTWAVQQARRDREARFAVVFLDLDGFKLINDSLGHLMGDELLQVIGERLRRDLRTVDTAARFGGDEFAVLLYGLREEAVLTVVDRIQELIAAPVLLGDHEVAVSASVGIATSDTGYEDAEDVLRDADIAMYHAKEAERGTACVFDPAMHSKATGRLQAQTELRTALLEEQFVVHYQPIVALDGSAVTQLEALVRWDHPARGILTPVDFLPVMADNGTIVQLGQWIIDTVCAQVAQWRRTYDGPVTVSVNLSHREFWSDRLLYTVTEALSRHHVPPRCLVLEITESVIMADPDAARQIMADLHATGVRMHIDDFGTGHSSLHALRAFPVDALKIDQSFVRQLNQDEQTTELVRLIVDMGRALGLDVVAEGVETSEQAQWLRGIGCDTAQGWLYAPALPGAEAGALLGDAPTETSSTAPRGTMRG